MRSTLSAALLFAVPFGLTACDTPVEPPEQQALMTISVAVADAPVAAFTLEVTGPGIPEPLTANFAVVEGVASTTLSVPAGSARRFFLSAYDDAGIRTHEGAVTVDIVAGEDANVGIVLEALEGSAKVIATVSSFTIELSPESATVAVGQTVQFEAMVIAADGSEVSDANVTWASTVPPVASVSDAGLATGRVAGDTHIVVSFRGVAVRASLTVTE